MPFLVALGLLDIQIPGCSRVAGIHIGRVARWGAEKEDIGLEGYRFAGWKKKKKRYRRPNGIGRRPIGIGAACQECVIVMTPTIAF